MSSSERADFASIPLIDVSALVAGTPARAAVAREIGAACRESGFFSIVGHGVDPALERRLDAASRRFFALDDPTKSRISMAHGGRAWRGWFRVGEELTSGMPDRKEGLYFGSELAHDHPAVRARTPLHGPNLFPAEVPELRDAVLAWIDAMTALGHRLLEGIALALRLDASWFASHLTRDPLVLFRIFNYPSAAGAPAGTWGVGEHTDYGLLTILRQDDAGGLEVRSRSRWVAVPPVDGTFVCNIGDMLDRMTRGAFRSTPHRVMNRAPRDRVSFAFFFDPNFFARVEPIAVDGPLQDDAAERWDKSSVHAFEGTYGEYLLKKVGKVFPHLLSATQ